LDTLGLTTFSTDGTFERQRQGALLAKGYVTLFHYGCTTGVAQINDTDLHGDMEAIYLEFEQAAFFEQQLYDPGCISRTLQARARERKHPNQMPLVSS